jgi:3-oxoacyl-[acyl-carrier protein] reductase
LSEDRNTIVRTDLENKCVLITGASGGVGQATAKAFAAEGATLVLHCHRNRRAVEELLSQPAVGGVVTQADLRDEAQTGAMFDDAAKAFSRVDAVVVNAGIWDPRPVPLQNMSLDQWQRTLSADLTSAFLTCRAYFRHLADVRPESASITLVGSTAALFGEADHADYASAKSALTYGLTLSLKNEIVRLAPRGRVNCVCPGWTDTPMAAKQIADPDLVRQATATRPIREIARPEDIARAIVFLSSNAMAGHITGAILPVAGGMEGRLLHP